MSDVDKTSAVLGALEPIEDEELRRGVLELFEYVRDESDGGSVDLVVLSARRLACLYQLLIESGMQPLEGVMVVSDRFLDTCTDWQWSDVLVLDDSVVLGTTMYKLHAKLRARVNSDGEHPRVRTAAVVVDTEQRAPYLLEAMGLHALHERTAGQVERFSTGVVQSLFGAGIPFFSDFPTTVELSSPIAAWGEWLADDDWFVADVTAPLLDEQHLDGAYRSALVQVPKDDKIDAVLSRLSPAVATLVDSFKVRSYVSTLPDGSSTIRFVPIAMLRPVSPQALDAALTEICEIKAETECPVPNWPQLAPQAKHRLVQLFASIAAFRIAFSSTALGEAFSGQAAGWDVLPMRLYFGDPASSVLQWADQVTSHMQEAGPYPPRGFDSDRLNGPRTSRWLNEPDVMDLVWEQRELIDVYGLPEEPDRGELTKIGFLFAHGINSIFGLIAKTYERKQRDLIRGLPDVGAYEETFGEGRGSRVLNQGITLQELTRALIPGQVDESSWSRSCLSLGIDIGNDLGIIVPDTRFDSVRNVVYRCYRMGETASLVDEPLPQAVRTLHWDDLTKTVDRVPLDSRATEIKPYLERQTKLQLQSLDEVIQLINAALPGVLRERYEGTVTSLDAETGTFDADLLLMDGSEAGIAIMQIAKVPSRQRDRVRPGAKFRWSIYEHESDAFLDSTSRLRMNPPVVLDLERLTEDARALAESDADR